MACSSISWRTYGTRSRVELEIERSSHSTIGKIGTHWKEEGNTLVAKSCVDIFPASTGLTSEVCIIDYKAADIRELLEVLQMD